MLLVTDQRSDEGAQDVGDEVARLASLGIGAFLEQAQLAGATDMFQAGLRVGSAQHGNLVAQHQKFDVRLARLSADGEL